MKFLKITKPYRLKDYKFTLVILVLAISFLGVLVIGSANEAYQGRQLIGLAGSVVLMIIASLIDYVWIANFYWIFYILSVGMLGLVLIPGVGEVVNGARRWINLGFTNFQPSELAKIFLIIFFARFIMKHEEDLSSRRTILKAVILILIPLVLIYEEPNLSTTICTAALFCMLMYVGGLSYKFIGMVLLVTVPVAIILLSIVVQPDQQILDEYQQRRILAWLNPEEYSSDEAYQQNNSVIAIGSGQLTGKGLNNNSTTSVKNGNFILEPQTDFIFAIVGEELGFVGCCIFIALLLLIVIQCILIGIRAQDTTGKIICCGVGSLIGIQTFINIGVATQIIPNTGIPLPFVSYGLTSLGSMYLGIGLVLNVGLQPKKYQDKLTTL
ncbi:FtsW/RodA/SpoVE family cell cycle protein [Lachnoclostridium sp. An118]|uniref:FtsW/RodA/SpoVE family cell cycle protein n=1 Tax=Lachnoclostridium sp. An118 TaxID=1965547 RepID=UPI000B37BD86|nr:FtsW/RodA/SpoVE family cell cycle protein [Lachnoclostridium sp. An118]OUQ50756.1 rod shape-determining protein RodA [Lachnoclostridium sp. An118]